MIFYRIPQNAISKQLVDISNISLSTGVFPVFQVVHVYKKAPNWTFPNYRMISLLSNTEKIFEKLIYNLQFLYYKYSHLSTANW